MLYVAARRLDPRDSFNGVAHQVCVLLVEELAGGKTLYPSVIDQGSFVNVEIATQDLLVYLCNGISDLLRNLVAPLAGSGFAGGAQVPFKTASTWEV